MADNKHKTIGIIGGMGPMATLDLYEWIIALTPAQKDQDHLPILINNSPQTPDRTGFILGQGEDPRPNLLSSARLLEESGADILAIPCNTAHAFVEEIEQGLTTAKVINMLEETKQHIQERFYNKEIKIGLLATTGTIQTNLYQKNFEKYPIIVPDQDMQKIVMESIYGNKGIKSGYKNNSRKLLKQVVEHLYKKGANVIILGCTEISLVFRNERNNGVVYINPVKILAQSLVERSMRHDN